MLLDSCVQVLALDSLALQFGALCEQRLCATVTEASAVGLLVL